MTEPVFIHLGRQAPLRVTMEIPDEAEETTQVVTQLDRLEAQVTYTAMMTDTLLEVT